MRFILAKHCYTISTLQHVLGGYIVHNSCESFNNIVLKLITLSNSNMARARPRRAGLPQRSQKWRQTWRHTISLLFHIHCRLPFFFSYITTTLFLPTMEQQSLRRRGIFTSHSWHLWVFFTTHSWHHWQFQIWRRMEMFPTHSWLHWQFQIWRRRGGSHVTGEVEGGNFILGETITSPGICLTHYYLCHKGGSRKP